MKKTYSSLFAVAALAASAFAAQAATTAGSHVTLYGNLIYDQASQSTAPSGIYSTDVKPSATVQKVADAVSKANGGACLADTAYFAIEYTTKYGNINSCYLNSYNPQTWALTNQVEAPHSSVATSLTYSPVTKKIYGSFFSEERESFYFGSLDTKTANCDTIAFLDHSFNAIASTADGTLYFVNDEGNFGKISATDGTITIIGATGFTPKYLQDATFDFGTKQFYWFAFNDDDSQSGIYTVDLTSGKATRISTWATGGKEFVGVFSKTPVYAAGVPEIPANLSLAFAESALAGQATFTLPTATYGGEPLSGELGYELLVDGVVKVSGKSTAGAEVKVDLSVERGEHAVSVRATNGAGAGPEYICKQYFGTDVPAAVASASAARTQGGATIKWSAVTEGAHGAKFNPSTVTYNVTRFPDGVAVASGVKATECTDANSVSQLASYYYEVVAVDGDYQTAPAKTNAVVLGEALTVPYSKDFTDGDYSLFTIVDANADGSTWGSDFRGAKYTFNNYNTADDWLISPPLKVKAGQHYKVAVTVANAMDPYTEKVEVLVGTNASADALTTAVVPATVVDGGYRSPLQLEGGFKPDADADYFVGVHAISDAGNLYLYCYKLEVTSESTGITSAVQSQAVVRGENGGIRISGAEGSPVVVTAVDGRVVASVASAASELFVPASTGVYVVNVGGKATKVIVR